MAQVSTKLCFVHFRMVRSHIRELARMERALPIMQCIYRLAPVLGIFGSVVLLMSGFGTCFSPFDPASELNRALIPLALGILVSLLAFIGHAWLAAKARQFDRESGVAQNLLLESLAASSGEELTVKSTWGIAIKRKRRPCNKTIFGAILPWCQAGVVMSLLLFGVATATPSHWRPSVEVYPPHIKSGKALYRPDLHPGIWLDQFGGIHVYDGQGNLQVMDHIQAISRESRKEWLLVADRNAKYCFVEDLLEQFRLTGITKVYFLSN